MRTNARVLLAAGAALLEMLSASTACRAVAADGEPERKHELTVEDVLRMQDIGRVMFLRHGRTLVFEQMPPYEQAPNTRVLLSAGNDRSPLMKVLSVEVDSRDLPRPLFEQSPEGGYWLGAASPDGQKVSVYSLVGDQLRAGVFSFDTGTVRWFDFVPSYFDLLQRPLWINNEDLIFQRLPPDRRPPILGRVGLIEAVSDLWRAALSGRQPSATVLKSYAGGIGEPADPSTGGALVRVSASTGAARVLGVGFFYNIRISANRRYVAALLAKGPSQPDPHLPAPGTLNLGVKGVRVFDVEDPRGARDPCPRCDGLLGSLTWSSEGTELTFFAHDIDESDDASHLFRYAPRPSRLTKESVGTLAPGCGMNWRPRAYPFTRGILLAGRENAGPGPARTGSALDCPQPPRIDWFRLDRDGSLQNLTHQLKGVPADPVAVTAEALYLVAGGDLWRLTPQGTLSNLTHGSLPQLSALSPFSDRGILSREYRETGGVPPTSTVLAEMPAGVVVIDLPTRHTIAFTRPDASAQPIAYDEGRQTAVFRSETADGTRMIAVGPDRRPRTLISVNPQLADIYEARSVQLSYDVPGLGTRRSCLLLPAAGPLKARRKLIVEVYPSMPETCTWEPSRPYGFNPYSLRLMVAHGYAVLFPSVSWAETHFAEGVTDRQTRMTLAAIDSAVANGFVDPSRVGLYGFSQGFHDVLQILTETDRFRAAAALNGISDFSSEYGTLPLQRRLADEYTGDRRIGDAPRHETWLGAKPWEAPDRYLRNSPYFQADRIHTPLLILHSDLDMFPIGQSEEIFTALYRLQKEATYVTYWGEGHGNLSPANIRDMWERLFKWFDDHLN